jgi:hypothetical protein
MSAKRRKTIIICCIILALSMVVLAISTVIQVIHNGWEAITIVNFAPFIGMAVAITTVLINSKKNNEE